MKIEVYDNFLPKEEFENLRDIIVWNFSLPFYFQPSVTAFDTNDNCKDNGFWNWYATHHLYKDDDYDSPRSSDFSDDYIFSTHFKSVYDSFIPRFEEMGIYTRLQRIKINMYPYTTEVMEHDPHYDNEKEHRGALFSLNTCNGFTKLHEGTRIDSVANRLMLFYPHHMHNSSTTSDAPARYNINFNFL